MGRKCDGRVFGPYGENIGNLLAPENNASKIGCHLAAMATINLDALSRFFGGVPPFHDWEVVSLALERRRKPYASAAIKIVLHGWIMNGVVADGVYERGRQALIEWEFGLCTSIRLDGWNGQNVIDDVELREVDGQDGARQILVKLIGIHGVSAEFFAESAAVTGVSPILPDIMP